MCCAYSVGVTCSLWCIAWWYYMLGYTRKLNHIHILKIRVLKYKYTNKHSDWFTERDIWKGNAAGNIFDSGFQLSRPFLFVTACRGKMIRFCLLLQAWNTSRRLHIMSSRVATQSRFSTFLCKQSKGLFSPRVGCVWVGERNSATISANFIEHPPSLPFLGMINSEW